MGNSIIFKNIPLRPLPDEEYYTNLIKLIQSSQQRLYCSVFIVDYKIGSQHQFLIDKLIFEIACANWRGVETKLIIGGSRTNYDILYPAFLVKNRAIELGIETKLAADSKDINSHVKLVVLDNMIITGSHNWSESMFDGHVQDSVLIQDAAITSYLEEYFNTQWNNIKNLDYDISI